MWDKYFIVCICSKKIHDKDSEPFTHILNEKRMYHNSSRISHISNAHETEMETS